MLSFLEQVDREHPVHNLLFSIIHESRGEQYLLIISEQANQCVQKALFTCVVYAHEQLLIEGEVALGGY